LLLSVLLFALKRYQKMTGGSPLQMECGSAGALMYVLSFSYQAGETPVGGFAKSVISLFHFGFDPSGFCGPQLP
jgi:hypothetical protein